MQHFYVFPLVCHVAYFPKDVGIVLCFQEGMNSIQDSWQWLYTWPTMTKLSLKKMQVPTVTQLLPFCVWPHLIFPVMFHWARKAYVILHPENWQARIWCFVQSGRWKWGKMVRFCGGKVLKMAPKKVSLYLLKSHIKRFDSKLKK